MPNKLFGLTPLDDHFEESQASMPGPFSTPIEYERSGNGFQPRCHISAPGNASGPASAQTTPDIPDIEGLVDSGVQLPLPTTNEDKIWDPRDSFDLPPTERPREILNIGLPSMTNEELEQFWRPVDNSGNMPFFRGGPNVPTEISRRLYDMSYHLPGQLYLPYACPALRRTLETSISFAFHPMGQLPWYIRQRLLQEQMWKDEQRRREEERLRQEKEQRRWRERQRIRREEEEHLRALIREENLRRQREEEDLQRITEEHEQIMRRPDLLTDRYKRPGTEEDREYCVRQHMEMLSKRASHTCVDAPCFNEACTTDLPGRTGCRYADSFHSNPNTNPCIWGWGLMLRMFEEHLGPMVARRTNLDDIAKWYRQRRRNDQRLQGPVLVTDPPNAPDRNKCYWVIAPPQQHGQSRGGPSRQ